MEDPLKRPVEGLLAHHQVATEQVDPRPRLAQLLGRESEFSGHERPPRFGAPNERGTEPWRTLVPRELGLSTEQLSEAWAWIYLLGRYLVMRQEALDRARKTDVDYNLLKHNPAIVVGTELRGCCSNVREPQPGRRLLRGVDRRRC